MRYGSMREGILDFYSEAVFQLALFCFFLRFSF